ncbi:MAG: T9SS type A sorting domain-containing protein [Bacteroidota bacterium]
MRRTLLSTMIMICSFMHLYAQTYNLAVIDGYGSGSYQAGDTIHIWSEAYDNSKTFSKWTGDTQYLLNPNEWHSSLIMPNQNITVASLISNIPSYTINYEQIMGASNPKNVYSCFPSNIKGVIYLLHGTGGSASNWNNTVEYRSFVNAAIADSFGIIATEAEEITLNSDLNSDGKLRWLSFPIDTINGIDYLNIKAITDTFINRGEFNTLTPKFSVGMSNGGSFSAALSYAYDYQAGISYCASSNQAIFSVRNNSFGFRMAKHDDHPEVGAEGNYQAWQNDSILADRGICHDYKIHDRQPLYPERFARIPGISIVSSQAIFNDLWSNGQLDLSNFALHSDTIKYHVLANPSLYPSIIALSPTLQIEVLNQIAASNAEHKFYSDYNFETLDFIDNLCSPSLNIHDIDPENSKLIVYPNPASEELNIVMEEDIYSIEIINNTGQSVLKLNDLYDLKTLDVSSLKVGMYFVRATNNTRVLTSKFVKE